VNNRYLKQTSFFKNKLVAVWVRYILELILVYIPGVVQNSKTLVIIPSSNCNCMNHKVD